MMNRKAFLRALLLGALAAPALPKKLILTGGWFDGGIHTDFRVGPGRVIEYTGTGRRYTVLELHRWLQELGEQMEPNGRDETDITEPPLSHRYDDFEIALTAGCHINEATAMYLHGGTITQRALNGLSVNVDVWTDLNCYRTKA